MRVEVLQNTIYSDVHNTVGIDIIHVFVFNVINEAGEFFLLLIGREEAARIVGKVELCAQDDPEGTGKAQQ